MNSAQPDKPSRDRRSEIERVLQQAEELRREGRHEEGIQLIFEALPHGVGRAQLYYRLGNLYYDSGAYERAEFAYRQAITHDPLHINAYHNLGVVYRRQGRVEESLRMRRKANRLARQHPERIGIKPEELKQIRRFALRWFLLGLGVVVLVTLLVMLVSSLLG